ncbi:conserved exported hypothetical protein [Microbacterium sp. 8M]|uniref:hypothetical protein n=1 Tax=Microbacterium sp. 8M TaxID=2653153 RepID=UPI0012F07AF7|nr:hypothetical protein [Microbacterium sp. 8M]VXB86613.1 conserved exported hypothetical protein [Microbacterium sp. 8M]
MTAERTRIPSRVLLAAGAALALVGVSGCAAGTVTTDGKSSARPSVTATSPAPSPTATPAATDKVACDTYSDMLTILHNTDYSFYRGAISPQERTGWYSLAFRVIGRAPVVGDGPVAKALAALQAIQPPMQADPTTQDPTSVAWGQASLALAAACQAEGFPTGSRGFVGG